MRYRIEVGEQGSVVVTDNEGTTLWSQETGTPGSDPETLCDALLAALSWAVQHHTGALTVSVPERTIATGLESESVHASPRLATMLGAARALLTWFETAEVACCGGAAVC
ncbi:MAG: reverse transcriptase-like protein [Deltaproteobacteria bacterium]|nr:reverse transcriptase-like protein [Deltaproteobacteria bacterium]